MNDEIMVVKQLPIIGEQLRELRDYIKERTDWALALPVSEDNLKEIRSVRSELKKEYTELENRRKAIKREVMEPYEKFEAIYKDCVGDAMWKADSELGLKIRTVEGEMKDRVEKELRKFFTEAAKAAGVEWLQYEQVGVKIGLNDARAKVPKKLMDFLSGFVLGVADCQETIMKMDDADAVMAEFRKSLDLNSAVRTVQMRKDAERQAREAREQAEKAEEERKASGFAPPVLEAPKQAEKVYTLKFAVKATKPELVRLKAFLDSGNYEYKSI